MITLSLSTLKCARMVAQTPVPSKALLRSLQLAPTSSSQCMRTVFRQSRRKIHTSRCYLEEQDSEPRKSFRGQLYESTAQRLKRQRDEEALFRSNKPTTAFARNGAIAFSIVGFSLLSYLAGSMRPYERVSESTLSLERTEKLRHDTRPHTLQGAWIDLCLILGEENLSEKEDDRQHHSGSEWSSYETKENERPAIVCYPKSTQQVSEIMKMCHRRRLPVTAYSGGTSLEGHFSATRGGICIDFQRMDEIIKLHKDDLDVGESSLS